MTYNNYTRAHCVLEILIKRKLLKTISFLSGNISYKYLHNISKQKEKPAAAAINKLSYLIPWSFWQTPASPEFMLNFEESLIPLRYPQLIPQKTPE